MEEYVELFSGNALTGFTSLQGCVCLNGAAQGFYCFTLLINTPTHHGVFLD
jgi:hypothetical protein